MLERVVVACWSLRRE